MSLHKRFSIQKIRIYQAGIEHPNVKGFAQIIPGDLLRSAGIRKVRQLSTPGIA